MNLKSITPTETDILRACRDYLRLKGWYVIRIQQGIGSHKGLSDLIALKAGRVVFAEVKTPRGRQSVFQKVFQEDIERQGCEYAVLRSVDDAIQLDKGLEAPKEGER